MPRKNTNVEDEIKKIIKKWNGQEYKLKWELIIKSDQLIDNCTAYLADELCKEGIGDDGEINQYGEHLEDLVDYLLNYKFMLEDHPID